MQPTREINKDHGLQPLPEGVVVPSLTKVFGGVAIADLPDADFFVAEPLEIKDQDQNYNSDFCASYAGASVSEDQEGVELVPEWTFAKAKQLLIQKLKNPTEDQIMAIIKSWGLNLVDVCEAGIKYGFLAKEYDHFKCDTPERPERDILADYRNWPEELDMLGYEHAKSAYFAVDGPYDTFDNIRAALYKNQGERRSVLTGVNWRASWGSHKDGMIPTTIDPTEQASGHAFKIFGQMRCADGIRLVAQLSDGTWFGDKGLFYFPREIVNSQFTFGSFTFKDQISQEKAQYHSDLNLPIDSSIFLKIIKTIIHIFELIFNKK